MKRIIYLMLILVSSVLLVSCKEDTLGEDILEYLNKINLSENYSTSFRVPNIVYETEIVWTEEGSNYLTFTKDESEYTTISFSAEDINKEINLKGAATYNKREISRSFSFIINKQDEVIDEQFKPIFRVDSNYEITHLINEVFTPPVLIAYDHTGNISTKVTSNNVNINDIGTYTVTYSATNDLGTTTYNLKVNVVEEIVNTGYYESITASSSNPSLLFSQLRTLISDGLGANGEGNVTYGQIRDLLIESDVDMDDTTKLRGIYKEEYFIKKWDSAATWNREHVWPQSRLEAKASNGARNRASDAHNLRVIGTATNSDRGNDIFTNVTNKGSTYFPSNRDKGDVARIMLYMVVRYDALSLAVTGGNGIMGDIRVFNNWHIEDPVDAFEIQRNNVIEDWQGNRNPFIDHPEWFNAIWQYLIDEAGITALEAINYALSIYENLSTNYVPFTREQEYIF